MFSARPQNQAKKVRTESTNGPKWLRSFLTRESSSDTFIASLVRGISKQEARHACSRIADATFTRPSPPTNGRASAPSASPQLSMFDSAPTAKSRGASSKSSGCTAPRLGDGVYTTPLEYLKRTESHPHANGTSKNASSLDSNLIAREDWDIRTVKYPKVIGKRPCRVRLETTTNISAQVNICAFDRKLIEYRCAFKLAPGEQDARFGPSYVPDGRVQLLPLVVTATTFLRFRSVLYERVGKVIHTLNAQFIAAHGSAEKAREALVRSGNAPELALADKLDSEKKAAYNSGDAKYGNTTVSDEETASGAGGELLLLTAEVVLDALTKSDYWKKHRHLSGRAAGCNGRTTEHARPTRANPFAVRPKPLSSGEYSAADEFRVDQFLMHHAGKWGRLILDAPFMADYLVAKYHGGLLDLFPMHKLEGISFDMRSQIARLRKETPFLLFVRPKNARVLYHRWWHEGRDESCSADFMPGLPCDGKDRGGGGGGGVGATPDADAGTSTFAFPSMSRLLLPHEFCNKSDAECSAAMERLWGSHRISTRRRRKGGGPDGPFPCSCRDAQKNSGGDMGTTNGSCCMLQFEPRTNTLGGVAFHTSRPFLRVSSLFATMVGTGTGDQPRPDKDGRNALDLFIGETLSPEQFMLLWFMEMLEAEEGSSKNTMFMLKSIMAGTGKEPSPFVDQMPHRAGIDCFRVDFKTYYPDSRKKNLPRGVYGTQKSVANTERLYADVFSTVFGTRFPFGGITKMHHNLLVTLVRIGLVVVRSYQLPIKHDGKVCYHVTKYAGFLRHRWNDASDAVRMLSFILARGVANSRKVTEVVDLNHGKTETDTEHRARIGKLKSTIIRDNPFLTGMPPADRKALLATVAKRKKRFKLDPSQQVCSVTQAVSPITLTMGSAGTGKTATLTYLKGTDEILAPRENGRTLIAQNGTVRIMVPTNMLRNAIMANGRPAYTIAYLTTYAMHNNNAKFTSATGSAGSTGPSSTHTVPTIEDRLENTETVVVDELGMCDEEQFIRILRLLVNCTKLSNLIFMADGAQLEPVSPGGVLYDLMEMPEVAVVRCAVNHRSASAEKDLAEACSGIATVGDSLCPRRVPSPHVPDLDKLRECVDEFAKQMPPGAEPEAREKRKRLSRSNRDGEWTPPLWIGKNASRRLDTGLARIQAGVDAVCKLANRSSDHRKALESPQTLDRTSAIEKARRIAEHIHHITNTVPNPSISLRRANLDSDAAAIRGDFLRNPNNGQILTWRHDTKRIFNKKMTEVFGWKHPDSKSMPPHLMVNMKMRCGETYRGEGVTLERNQTFLVAGIFEITKKKLSQYNPGMTMSQIEALANKKPRRSTDPTVRTTANVVVIVVLQPLNEPGSVNQPRRLIVVPYTPEFRSSLVEGWASTTYSSQGTQVPRVTYALDGGNNPMTYTTLTRATSKVEIIHDKSWNNFGYNRDMATPVSDLVASITKVDNPRITAIGWALAHRDSLSLPRMYDPVNGKELEKQEREFQRKMTKYVRDKRDRAQANLRLKRAHKASKSLSSPTKVLVTKPALVRPTNMDPASSAARRHARPYMVYVQCGIPSAVTTGPKGGGHNYYGMQNGRKLDLFG